MILYGGALYGGAVDPEKFLPLLHVGRADGKGMIKGLRGIPILPSVVAESTPSSGGNVIDTETGEGAIDTETGEGEVDTES